ncbi:MULTISPECIES: carboxymuconolactone decarboxylase family protein [unclassified Paraburkholderia]|uniref:carboxymuconolactone decarboxylase family protein n=1 Tax=unclassified Paraburkholderia TaxID=2615204 RepID=UPI000D07C4CA|nr:MULTISPECIES: carboxymuconolactone decarboxylase family protein [unclassified Paraburkholderia]PRY08807.1 AhpD family alkylhydroperoxidase [Paraburkholderia sp. BL25I1N1]REE21988.1 AhpD family alkylhydroperoxidase [Paraburkholderia sp. BL27I4N3]REG50104.1 AhpD family alkylhydroperoxidase [Paraburkholderia sp. BL6669N2]RKR36057.1 AhpD family alkylhydroperoxidase [Paraburkholderia sp. BL17N1]TDY21610.1 AhpD family alkylhydroperoxidase [Paraburkholderia sp. BL6665CI2N2]
MLNWIDYRQELFGRIGEIAKLSPDTVRGYQALSTAGQKKDLLGARTRELIALAVAVSLRCDGCITVHTAEALKHGATREEIAEALGVAIAVNAGAAMVYSARTMDATAAYTAQASDAAQAATE